MKKNNKSKKKKIIIAIVIVLLIIIIRGVSKPKEVEEKMEIEAIEKRTISQSISATGTIQTENTKNVISQLTGTEIATVNVSVGQKIEVGDVICTFDMSNVQDSLSDAKSSANISNAQSNLAIESAQRNLNDAIKSRDDGIVKAQQEVASSQQAYENAQNQLNATTTAIATKQAQLSALQAQIVQIPVVPESETVSDSQSTTDSASIQIQIETLTSEIATLQASLPELQQTVNQLKSVFDAAVSTLNTTTSTLDSNIAAMQDNLKNAELSAQSVGITQKSQLDNYEEQLDKGTVRSTVSGTVTSVDVKPGDIYTGTNIATIEGCEDFIIESEIDEYDIPDIAIGMKVLIKTDATREEELEGTVIYTAPSATETTLGATTASSTATYKIKISLDTTNDRLRLGMNAKLSIISASKENVWSVPYNAVLEREDGSKYIEILKNEETEETEELDVVTGIEGTYYTEIISDELKDGMQVVLPKVENSDSLETLLQVMGADGGI